MTDDDQLISDLRRVLDAVDGPRIADSAAAKAAFGWHDIDAELAQLVFDSEQHSSDTGVVVRGSEEASRQLTFSTEHVTIDIEIGEAGLMGQIVPAQPATVELHQPGRDVQRLDTDDFGVFAIASIEPGPTTVVARAADGSWSVRTAWTAT